MYRQIEFAVTSESLAGPVSDRWKYTVHAEVFSDGLVASGAIAVDEHQLKPGTTRALADSTRKVVLPVRADDGLAQVVLSVTADGVTWRSDGDGAPALMVPICCPEPGAPPYAVETDIRLAIDDAPGFTGGEARLTVRARLVASAEPMAGTQAIAA